MPIDYSKWDKLDEYSEEDDDGNDLGSVTPRVTRLDAPSKITFGGGNAATIEPSLAAESSGNNTGAPAPPPGATRPKLSNPESTADHERSVNCHQEWTERGGIITTSPSSSNEDDTATTGRRLYWSQDRYSVYLRLELHDHEQMQSVSVTGIVPYRDRYSATGSTRPRLICRGALRADASTNQEFPAMILEGDLPHPVHVAEDDDDVDWSIIRDGSSTCRFVFITLYKAVPMQGVFVWWRRPLMQFPEVDVDHVKNPDGRATSSSANQDFVKAWDDAHRMFREKNKDAEQDI